MFWLGVPQQNPVLGPNPFELGQFELPESGYELSFNLDSDRDTSLTPDQNPGKILSRIRVNPDPESVFSINLDFTLKGEPFGSPSLFEH